ncbi:unnamed protein product [Ixodes persulcatus]
MAETERVRHVLKGIAEEAVTLFILQPPADVSAIMTICQSLEAASRQRIPVALAQPAHAVTPSLLQTDLSLQETIPQIALEEVARFFSPPTVEPTAASQHIRNLIRAELTQAPTVTCAPLITPPQPTYSKVLRRAPDPLPPQPLQPQLAALMTDTSLWQGPQVTWRPPTNPPVCYYCGIRGHISRFCRRRRADDDRNWQPRHNPNYAQSPREGVDYRQNQLYSDAISHSESQRRTPRRRSLSPYRRRSSLSPMNTGPPRTSFPSEN